MARGATMSGGGGGVGRVTAISTIGYEQATLGEVIARLQGADVDLLLDVRAIAASRRPGFSKTILAASLDEAGVGYLHLRDLGTPKLGRDAARAGRCDEMRAIFTAHLEEPAAIAALERAIDLSRAHLVCLLCYEADPSCCHREVVAARISSRTGAPILHL